MRALVAAALLLPGLAPAEPAGGGVAADVLSAHDAVVRAMDAGDVVQLDRLLEPSFRYVTATGAVRTRAAMVAYFSGQARAHPGGAATEMTERDVVLLRPDVAVVTSLTTDRIAVDGGVEVVRTRVTDVLVHRGRWRLAHSHESLIP